MKAEPVSGRYLGFAVLLSCAIAAAAPGRTIEDFEDGMVLLRSFPGEDVHPDSWRLDTLGTHNNSRYSLRIWGNTWKIEDIEPIALDSGSVWQVASRVSSLGEVHGFGLLDSAHTLLYALAGTEQLNPDSWVTVFQGAFPLDTWNIHDLPVTDDWLARFGYLPRITGIAFINDRDFDPSAVVYFDDVRDVTEDQPQAPAVEVWHTLLQTVHNRDGFWNVTVQFFSRVTDPDSRGHDYYWSFGDDSTSQDSWPVHTYVVRDDHQYTVLLEVRDSTGRWGRASCLVTLEPGPTSFPVRLNFVGDIMLARRYDTPGGIIDTLGAEGIFEPTRAWLGDCADVTVANLECPLTLRGTRHPTKPIVFRGRPSNVSGLAYAGIDVVSLANNHTTDYGLVGLRDTDSSLTANGIAWSGSGADWFEANRPLFRTRSGVCFGFLAYSDRTAQYDNYQPYLNAGYNKPGFADLDTWQIFRQIQAARRVADRVVVEMHSGDEYSPIPDTTEEKTDNRQQQAEMVFSPLSIPYCLSSTERGPDAGDEFYSPRALVPDGKNRRIRRRAIEAGADLVIGHHPHVLQGFEVHNGRLIAHSLGNFTFDLEYPETYHSAILNARVDGGGFYDFTVIPVHIDDYVPQRARGALGNHILDYLSRRSQELGTWLVSRRDSCIGRVILDTTAITVQRLSRSVPLALETAGSYRVSVPVRPERSGYLSAMLGVAPPGNWEFRIGRDMVWFGNCEDEGATLWLLNQADEFYDTVAAEGRRSVCQNRSQGSAVITTGLEERLICYSDSTDYTLYGRMKTDNGRNAGMAVKCYSARSGGTLLGTRDLGRQVTGNTNWSFYHREFAPPDNTAYLDLWLQSQGPQSGAGRTWFDDVGIIEWEGWQPFSGPVPLPAPNDLYWVQLRTTGAVANAELTYEDAVFEPVSGVGDRSGRRPGLKTLRCLPNPARGRAVIDYSLPQVGRVRLKVYNALGREVAVLLDEIREPGAGSVSWDGRGRDGRQLSAGTYFVRFQGGGEELFRRLVLVR